MEAHCRLASPEHTPPAEAAAALRAALPMLTDKGLNSRLVFVKANAISTLSSIIDAAQPAQVTPHLATLVAALLESLSSLEPGAFNKLGMAAAAQDHDVGDRLDSARLALAHQTPMHSALERCARLVTVEALDALVPALANLIRRGASSSCCTQAVCAAMCLMSSAWPKASAACW